MSLCRNCEAPLEATYCPRCGQKDLDLERPVTALLGDLIRETFDVDGRAIRTLWTLLRHPGLLTQDFLAGRRRRYSPPLRLYLVISVLFFLVTIWVVQRGMLLSPGQTLEADAPGQVRLFSDYVPRLMFFLLPVFALILKIAYRQRLYFHHLIHALHLHSAAYLFLIALLPLEKAADENTVAMVIQLALLAWLIAYFARSLRRVYRASRAVTAAKAIGVMLAYGIVLGATIEAVSHLTGSDTAALPILSD